MTKERWVSFNKHYRLILLYRYLQWCFVAYPIWFMFILFVFYKIDETRKLVVFFMIVSFIISIFLLIILKNKELKRNFGFNRNVCDFFVIKKTQLIKCNLNKIDTFLIAMEEAHSSLWHRKLNNNQSLMKFTDIIIDERDKKKLHPHSIIAYYKYFHYQTLVLDDIKKFLIGEMNFDQEVINVDYIILVAEFIEDDAKTFLSLENLSKYDFKIIIGFELSSGRFFFRDVYGFLNYIRNYTIDKDINKGMNILLNEIVNVNKMWER